MIKLIGAGYEREIKLKHAGNTGGFLDIPPLAGYGGSGTVYRDELDTGSGIVDLSGSFTLEDTDFPDRFSEICQLSDPITEVCAFLFRDHKTLKAIIIPNLAMNKEFSDRLLTMLEITYIDVADVEGAMSVRGVVSPDWKIIKQLHHLGNNGNYEPNDGTKYDKLPVTAVFSLGSTDDVFGPDTSVTVSQMVPHEPRRKRRASSAIMYCENLLLQFSM